MRLVDKLKRPALALTLVLALGMTACGETGNGDNESQELEGSKSENDKTENNETENDEMKKEIVTITDKAYASFSSFIDKYYLKSRVIEGLGYFTGDDMWFWEPAEMYEIVIDAYEHTGDQRYYDMILEIFEGFKEKHGEDWAWNEYNDDIAWMTIACTRAYNCTGVQEFLDIAVKHFNMVWDRGWSDDLGGGVWWRTDNQSKNACINCPLAIAACLLGDTLNDESYYEKAAQMIDWVVNTLYEDNGRVYDNVDISGDRKDWQFTYNQGTFIGANTLLYIHYGDREYYDRARKAVDYTMNNMYKGGVMNNEEGGDARGFKGILARWLYCFGTNCSQADVFEWLKLNGETAWDNRNSDGIMTTQLDTKTPEKANVVPFSASAPVSVLNNCREDDVKITVSDTIDIDLFTRCGKVIISGEKGSARTIETKGSNAWLEYTGVRFDSDCTSLQFSLAADQDCTVEIRLDAWDGELLAALTVPGGDTLQTVQAEIEKVSDRHNVYIVIPEEGRKLSY